MSSHALVCLSCVCLSLCVDLASLVMVHYLWSDVVTTPQTPNPLNSLPVVLDLPKALLMSLLGNNDLAERVYKGLLRPSGSSEVFFLQDLLTLFNGCGWRGRLKEVTSTLPFQPCITAT